MARFIKLPSGNLLNLSQIAQVATSDAPKEGFGYTTEFPQWQLLYGDDTVAILTITLLDGSRINVSFVTIEERDSSFRELDNMLRVAWKLCSQA